MKMPQLWKTSRPPERASGSSSTGPALVKNFEASNGPRRPTAANLPPLIMSQQPANELGPHRTNGAIFGDRSPVEAPTSPVSPHYDQLLIELRLAQERRNRHKADTCNDVAPTVSADPAPAKMVPMRMANGASPGHQKPERINNLNCTSPSPLANSPSPVTSANTAASTKTGPKKVRFLEDGTGNLHTSIFGGSSESLGSLLDAHQELQGADENISIDALISSLANYEKRVNGMAKNTSSLQNSPLVTAAKQNGVNGKVSGPPAVSVAHTNGTNGHDAVSKAPIPPALKPTRIDDIRVPNVVLQVLNQSSPEPDTVDKVEVFDPHNRMQSFLETFHYPSNGVDAADVIRSSPQNNVFHLEPDDPNSVDSGSVLSELDFEETSSTITTESNKTGDSLSSPVNMNRTASARANPPTSQPSRPDTSDLFAEVSDLLERSLQEIRRMEEDTVKIPEPEEKKAPELPPPLLSRMPSSGSIREPLYELIGRKRTPPAHLCFRSNRTEAAPAVPAAPAAPVPPPAQADPIPAAGNLADVWIPRADWVPPSGRNGAPPPNVWARRPADMSWMVNGAAGHCARNNRNNTSSRAPFEEQSIYGRLWEAASNGVHCAPVNGSRDSSGQQLKQLSPHQSNAQEQQNQTAIRSMARKARLEHWRLAGMPAPEMNGHASEMMKSAAAIATSSSTGENGVHHNGTNGSMDTSLAESSHTTPAFLSSLPLFQIPANQRNESTSNGSKLLPKKLGFQLTWPPPPIPHSPCSSSASATPVSPTCPNFPGHVNNGDGLHNGHAKCSPNSPKCFGHDQTFQWPVPALPIKGSKIVQRSGSFKQETWTDSSSSASSDLGANKKGGSSPFQRSESLKEKRRAAKPANLDAAQDWYWVEEFPRGSGIEPGTGNMSTWFHGAISRSEAEARLTNQPTGAFLARLTERLWGYALSVKNATGHVSHFLIDAGEKWHAHTKYTLLGSPDPPQKTLRELIQFYGKQPLTPDGLEKLLFPCPQESAVRCSSRLK